MQLPYLAKWNFFSQPFVSLLFTCSRCVSHLSYRPFGNSFFFENESPWITIAMFSTHCYHLDLGLTTFCEKWSTVNAPISWLHWKLHAGCKWRSTSKCESMGSTTRIHWWRCELLETDPLIRLSRKEFLSWCDCRLRVVLCFSRRWSIEKHLHVAFWESFFMWERKGIRERKMPEPRAVTAYSLSSFRLVPFSTSVLACIAEDDRQERRTRTERGQVRQPRSKRSGQLVRVKRGSRLLRSDRSRPVSTEWAFVASMLPCFSKSPTSPSYWPASKPLLNAFEQNASVNGRYGTSGWGSNWVLHSISSLLSDIAQEHNFRTPHHSHCSLTRCSSSNLCQSNWNFSFLSLRRWRWLYLVSSTTFRSRWIHKPTQLLSRRPLDHRWEPQSTEEFDGAPPVLLVRNEQWFSPFLRWDLSLFGCLWDSSSDTVISRMQCQRMYQIAHRQRDHFNVFFSIRNATVVSRQMKQYFSPFVFPV